MASREEIYDAMSKIEDVLDVLTEVGNGTTDDELWDARDKLFKARDVIIEHLEEHGLSPFVPIESGE